MKKLVLTTTLIAIASGASAGHWYDKLDPEKNGAHAGFEKGITWLHDHTTCKAEGGILPNSFLCK